MTLPIIKDRVVMNFNAAGLAQNMKDDLAKAKAIIVPEDNEEQEWALVIGCSTGYGLAARQVLTASGFNTVGVAFERPESAGATNIAEFEKQAEGEHVTFMGDCFTSAMKDQVIKFANDKGIKFSEVMYSVAAGRRINESAGLGENGKPQYWFSSIGPIGDDVEGYTLNIEKGELVTEKLPALSEQQIDDTVKVMGGDDWQTWMYQLEETSCLTADSQTYCLSYVGTELNAPLYRDGSLGAAKNDLIRCAKLIQDGAVTNIEADVVVARALVTRASAYIPNFAPYIMALEQVGELESPLDQMIRLYEVRYNYDDQSRIRLDDLETNPEVQEKIEKLLSEVTPENFKEILAYDRFHAEILNQHGF